MDGAQRHDANLLLMFSALKAKRDRLMMELAEVDRDLDAVWRTASIELNNRQAAAAASGGMMERASARSNSSVELRPQRSTAPGGTQVLALPVLSGQGDGSDADTDDGQHSGVRAMASQDNGPVLVARGTPFKGRSVPPPPETLAALATLGPVRDDSALPSTVDTNGQRLEVAGMPTSGAALAAAKAAMRDIADQAARRLRVRAGES